MAVRRLFTRVGVGGLMAGRWYDLADSPQVRTWEELAYVTDTDYNGASAPAELSRVGCCGMNP